MKCLFCLYPAVIVGVLLVDANLRNEGQSVLAPMWFKALVGRYESWADGYLKSGYARTVDELDVSGTEWPMFGTVYFLVTADELQQQGKLDIRHDALRRAVDKAAEIVVSPDTATWVKAKWGDAYLTRENVFYRMLLILGLSSYERLTGEMRYRELMSAQRKGLAGELDRARFHVLDDYPGDSYGRHSNAKSLSSPSARTANVRRQATPCANRPGRRRNSWPASRPTPPR